MNLQANSRFDISDNREEYISITNFNPCNPRMLSSTGRMMQQCAWSRRCWSRKIFLFCFLYSHELREPQKLWRISEWLLEVQLNRSTVRLHIHHYCLLEGCAGTPPGCRPVNLRLSVWNRWNDAPHVEWEMMRKHLATGKECWRRVLPGRATFPRQITRVC